MKANAYLAAIMLATSFSVMAGDFTSYPQIVQTCATECLKEYRLPIKKDMRGYWLKCKLEKKRPYYIHGDFNGDSHEDYAFILIEKKGSGCGLFVLMSSKHKYSTHVVFTSKDSLYYFTGIDTVNPGTYATATGRGYGSQIQGEPDSVKLNNKAIKWYQCEGGSAYYCWNETKKQFIEVWISD